MMTAREWKTYYARERESLGEAGLRACLERAPHVEWPVGGALIFPHTRLDTSGALAAAAALAVLRTGCDDVLALGVLHGARETDAALVANARAGDPAARHALRRVHGPDLPGDGGHWREEFSLDGFCALLETAARCEGRRPPRVWQRYPFLVGDSPADLTGTDELPARVARGALLVATADPIHHGAGYGTLVENCLPTEDPRTRQFAEEAVRTHLDLLTRRDFHHFQRHATEIRSDFRDGGPIAIHLLSGTPALTSTLHALAIVDYADILHTPAPTWVAASLVTIQP